MYYFFNPLDKKRQALREDLKGIEDCLMYLKESSEEEYHSIKETPAWLKEGIDQALEEMFGSKPEEAAQKEREEVDKPERSIAAKLLEGMGTLFEDVKEATQRTTVTTVCESAEARRVKIYTLDEIKNRLTSAGVPVGTAPITEKDEIRQEITDQFVEFVEDSYWHTNYDKENGKIVAQVNRYTAALQLKEWGGEEAKDKKDKRDNLIRKNKVLRALLGLANLDPTGTKEDEYALDPFVEPRIKQAMDHDEARACGGTCHSEDLNLSYHIVDLKAVLGAGGYNVADISKQQDEKWEEQLMDLLSNEDVGAARIQKQEEKDARAATVAAVDAFVSNWNAGTRAGILALKEMVLSQRLIERQIANLKAVNADLNEEIKHRAGDDLGGAGSEEGLFKD